jgi:hypothetical protein
MFAIPAISALFTVLYLRPHEVFDLLRPITMNGMVVLVLFAYGLDIRLGFARPRGSALLGILIALVGLSIFTIILRAPDHLSEQLAILGVSLCAFLAASEGIQTLRALGVVAAVILALTVVIAAVGIHQGLAPSICYLRGEGGTETTWGETIDGRPCTEIAQCEEGGVTGADYLCEHPGLFGTHSIGGRVRFRGLLEDPNELCLALTMGMPLAFGLYERRRSSRRLAMMLAAFALIATCVIMTQSRSGQVAMMAALGVYFVRRFGRRGAIVAALFALPLLLLGGRTGAEADSSSEERLECWHEALEMWRENPFFGVGQGQFGQHHYLTAHNSFLLALAELGPLGLMLFTAALYMSLKITVRAQLDLAGRPEAAVARSWAAALTASLAGLVISAFFLSVAYHTLLWMFLGLAGAVYAVVRTHNPEWRVRFGWRDGVVVVLTDIVMVIGLSLYVRLKGA